MLRWCWPSFPPFSCLKCIFWRRDSCFHPLVHFPIDHNSKGWTCQARSQKLHRGLVLYLSRHIYKDLSQNRVAGTQIRAEMCMLALEVAATLLHHSVSLWTVVCDWFQQGSFCWAQWSSKSQQQRPPEATAHNSAIKGQPSWKLAQSLGM